MGRTLGITFSLLLTVRGPAGPPSTGGAHRKWGRRERGRVSIWVGEPGGAAREAGLADDPRPAVVNAQDADNEVSPRCDLREFWSSPSSLVMFAWVIIVYGFVRTPI